MFGVIERNAHIVLWVIGVACLLLFLLATGFLRVLPDDDTPQFVRLLNLFLGWVDRHQAAIQTTGKFAAAVITLGGVALSIVQGIAYARKNLPHRFNDLMKQNDQILAANREKAKALIQQGRMDLQTNRVTLHVGPLNRALKELNLGAIPDALKSLDQVSADIRVQTELAQNRLDSLRQQEATAFLLRGIIHMSAAHREKNDFERRKSDLQGAEGAFTAALSIQADEVDAIELRAETRLLDNREPEARKDFEWLRHTANKRSKNAEEELSMRLVEARACRRLAELQNANAERTDRQSHFEKTRTYFDPGIENLMQVRDRLRPDHLLELGRLCHLAARVYAHPQMARPVLLKDVKTKGLDALNDHPSIEAERLRKELTDISVRPVHSEPSSESNAPN